MLLAKHRELRRRDAVREGHPPPNYARNPFIHSFSWEIAALALFVVGAFAALYRASG